MREDLVAVKVTLMAVIGWIAGTNSQGKRLRSPRSDRSPEALQSSP